MKKCLRLVRELLSQIEESDEAYTRGSIDTLKLVEEGILDLMWERGIDDD